MRPITETSMYNQRGALDHPLFRLFPWLVLGCMNADWCEQGRIFSAFFKRSEQKPHVFSKFWRIAVQKWAKTLCFWRFWKVLIRQTLKNLVFFSISERQHSETVQKPCVFEGFWGFLQSSVRKTCKNHTFFKVFAYRCSKPLGFHSVFCSRCSKPMGFHSVFCPSNFWQENVV